MSLFIIPIFIIGLFGSGDLTIYGLNYSGSPQQLITIWILLLSTLAAFVAIGILWGKDWAISLAIPYAYLAILTCIVGIALHLGKDDFCIPFELILLIPFINILSKNSALWKDFNPQKQEKQTANL
ncbi:hypothetical protein P4E94_19300 [Pontiellaceae bacterium B12219]|nr:hypothetical protein [Pontiellaceae bacterium B12219]